MKTKIIGVDWNHTPAEEVIISTLKDLEENGGEEAVVSYIIASLVAYQEINKEICTIKKYTSMIPQIIEMLESKGRRGYPDAVNASLKSASIPEKYEEIYGDEEEDEIDIERALMINKNMTIGGI